MNVIAYFEIQASHPDSTVTFYENVFGWHFTRDQSLPIEYYRIETPGMHGGLLKRTTVTPAAEMGTSAFVCSIEVANFDDCMAAILKNGGRIVLPKFAVPGKCWQGYFADNDNNNFGILEVDEHAR